MMRSGQVRLAQHVRFGELGPKTGGIDQGAGSDVIRVGIFPVRREKNARPQQPKRRRQFGSRFQSMFKGTIREPQVAPPGQAKNRGGQIGLEPARFQRPKRGRLAIRQIEHANAGALRTQQENRTAYSQLGVVGMRSDYKVIQRFIGGL